MTEQSSAPLEFNPSVYEASELMQPAGQVYDDIVAKLTQEGERLHPGTIDRLDDRALINGLLEATGSDHVALKEFIRHSNRFTFIDRFGGLFDPNQSVEIPSGDDNLNQYGRPRREEQGHRLDMSYVRQMGIDPSRVLYFRVTQPSNTPKPEYYWTSDYTEVRTGLTQELRGQAATAVILVSTLEDISKNGGLMDDINDDQGIAVRQIGLATYDQRQALCIVPRP